MCIHRIPIYDLSVERSIAVFNLDGNFSVETQKPKNIWYVGFKNPHLIQDDVCIEWHLNGQNKTECIDHDTQSSEQLFSFPVLSDPVTEWSFRILGQKNIDPDTIEVYSLDTRTSGSQIALRLPRIFAENGIVSRAEWGADESIRYTDNPKWKAKYAASLDYLQRPKTQAELDTIKIRNERSKFLRENFWYNTQTTSLTRTENWHILVWPIEKVKQISRIVIHHTAESMDSNKSDEDMIRAIYAYHTLSHEWGDIGYNYIIGQRGTIYEWRAGWDYVVASHALYNNMGTVGISILGDYNKNHLNGDQVAGVERAVSMMATKYGITLSDTKKWVIKCDTPSCYPFQIVTTKSLIWHQDVGRTDCPGSDAYGRIPDIITRLDRRLDPVLNPISWIIDPLPIDQVMNMTLKPVPIDTSTNTAIINTTTLNITNPPSPIISIPTVRYIGPKFRIRLSYPDEKEVTLATADGKSGRLTIDKRKIPMKVSQKIQVWIVWNTKISLKVGEKYFTWSVVKLAHTIIRIDSWDRSPDWDKIGKYNDNIFRDTIRIVNEDGILRVINDLPIEWYLKWLGEVSNTDLAEKIKVIIVAARSYARSYMDPKNRKFATNLYDGSDNPDEFQKYLGYSYELRSPNVAKLVDMTRNQVVTYSGKLIKPWYHSSSDGKTISALEYCQNNATTNCVDIPYLQSVSDPGGVWRTRMGHGVGISWIWSTYFASQWWDYKKIIQYYLHGVEIQRK